MILKSTNAISYYDTEVILTCTEHVSECKEVILENTNIYFNWDTEVIYNDKYPCSFLGKGDTQMH